jgi:hypothetical protein
MDRGDRTRDDVTGGLPQGDSVASDASARVGEILSAAEQEGAAVRKAAEREAAATERTAREEAERILADAREAARTAGRERADRVLALRGAIAARGPALVEGLEGAGLTRRRLETLIEALDAAAERMLAEADAPVGQVGSEKAVESETDAPKETQTAPEETDSPAEAEASSDEPEPVPHDGDGSNGDRADGAEPYDGPLPEGAPMMRKPRTRQSDVRFAAVLLAVQGQEREEVEHHLRNQYGAADCEPILDEVFGTPA